MDISIERVSLKEKEVLNDLITEYQKEILGSNYADGYRFFDSYWEKKNRYPFFIKYGEEIAGFVLVNSHTLVLDEGRNIAEFYIAPTFRNKGIGKIAAHKVFDLFPGYWEVRELRENTGARSFWRRIIDAYNPTEIQEILLNNDDWDGYVQTFCSTRK